MALDSSQTTTTTTLSWSPTKLAASQLDSRMEYVTANESGTIIKSGGAMPLTSLAPGETTSLVRLYLSVNNVTGISNIRLGLVNTGGIPLTGDTFGIAFSSEILDDLSPTQYFQGINDNELDDSPYNIDVPNNTIKDSQYVYLTISIPLNYTFKVGLVRFKWFFNYAGVPEITSFTTTIAPTITTPTTLTTPTSSSTTTALPTSTTTTPAQINICYYPSLLYGTIRVGESKNVEVQIWNCSEGTTLAYQLLVGDGMPFENISPNTGNSDYPYDGTPVVNKHLLKISANNDITPNLYRRYLSIIEIGGSGQRIDVPFNILIQEAAVSTTTRTTPTTTTSTFTI